MSHGGWSEGEMPSRELSHASAGRRSSLRRSVSGVRLAPSVNSDCCAALATIPSPCRRACTLSPHHFRRDREIFRSVRSCFFACCICAAVHSWHWRLSRRSKGVHGPGPGSRRIHLSQPRPASAGVSVQRLRLQPDRATGHRRHQGPGPAVLDCYLHKRYGRVG